MSAQGAAAPERSLTLLERMRHRDHTRGSILGSVVVLALPSILMSAFGFGLFQLVDLRFLSLLGDSHVAAAGATNQTLRQAFMLLIMGLSVSSQMMVARLVGQGQVDAAEHVAGQSFVLGAGVALLGLLTVGLFPGFFVSLVAPDPTVAALGTEYARIAFLTMGVMVAVQVFNAVLNGAGDTTTPMIISIGSAVLVGAPAGFLLATRTDLGATGMWIANLLYASVNASITIGWLLSGRWARRADAFV